MVAVLVFTGTDFEGMKEESASEEVLAIVRRMPGIIGMRGVRGGVPRACMLVDLGMFSCPVLALARSWQEMLFNLHFSGLAGRPDLLRMVLIGDRE